MSDFVRNRPESVPIWPQAAPRTAEAATPAPEAQTSGRSIGGLSRVAPPALNNCAGRPP
ncbi:hypothetical protein Slala02_37880 [Streptomyces lavendulae subsp. lavendulae]|nr:hypothetical protein Slala01_76810 [Streptomyces lavendulae subsp. lavendulae]GLX27968.1 hypothetical protein Slala02_37880 [Streptomyces lavendulae subsp. lavendulae]